MESSAINCTSCIIETNIDITPKVGNKMIGCQNCKFSSCPIINKSECPFNVLWEESVKLEEHEPEFKELLPDEIDSELKELAKCCQEITLVEG